MFFELIIYSLARTEKLFAFEKKSFYANWEIGSFCFVKDRKR